MSTVYGYCPQCGGLGMSRERRKDGNDRCENGHSYPSSSAVANPLLPVATEHTVATERAAVVAWLRSRGMADYAQSNLDYAATMIERGGHLREETE